MFFLVRLLGLDLVLTSLGDAVWLSCFVNDVLERVILAILGSAIAPKGKDPLLAKTEPRIAGFGQKKKREESNV